MDKQLEEEALADLEYMDKEGERLRAENKALREEKQALYQLISDLELIVIDDHAAIDFAFANEDIKEDEAAACYRFTGGKIVEKIHEFYGKGESKGWVRISR